MRIITEDQAMRLLKVMKDEWSADHGIGYVDNPEPGQRASFGFIPTDDSFLHSFVAKRADDGRWEVE